MVGMVPLSTRVCLVLGSCVLATACNAVEKHSDVAYDDRYGDATVMDVYVPDDARTDRPALLMIHGGGWKSFSKSGFDADAERFAGAGYVVANINYRLTPAGRYPNAMRDTHCALAFLRSRASEYGLDPDRIAVMGYSAGGHLASLLGVAIDEPDFVPDCAAGSTYAPAAVISGAGPQDLGELSWASAVQDLIGGTVDAYPERYRKASPIERVGPGAPPFLFIHGTQDLFVPVEQSRRMRDALHDVGTDARLLTLSWGGHLLNNGADPGQVDGLTSAATPEAWAAMIDFLDHTIGDQR